MARVAFRGATIDDAVWMAPRLREADRRELIAHTGQHPEGVLRASVAMGGALTGEIDGVPAAIIGCPMVNALPRTGRPWMMGTDLIDEHPVPVGIASREKVEEWKGQVDLMVNYVDSRNRKAVKWLSWLGFTIEEARPLGPFEVPFHRFHWVS